MVGYPSHHGSGMPCQGGRRSTKLKQVITPAQPLGRFPILADAANTLYLGNAQNLRNDKRVNQLFSAGRGLETLILWSYQVPFLPRVARSKSAPM